jgi:hypothetical protein
MCLRRVGAVEFTARVRDSNRSMGRASSRARQEAADSPSACIPASSGPGRPLGEVVDESDADQILAIDELRALRDRIGAERAAPKTATSAAPLFEKPQTRQAPDPTEPFPASPRGVDEPDEDPWEALRRQAQGRQRWGRLVAAGGCLTLTAGAVAVLLITAHNRSVAPVAPVPTVSAVPVSPPGPMGPEAPVTPAAGGPAASVEPSAVLPMPSPVPPSATVPSAPAQDATGPQPQPAAVPAPRATHRYQPPTAPATQRPPAVAPADGWDSGPAPERVDSPREPAGSPDATLTRTPTSWSPAAPQ